MALSIDFLSFLIGVIAGACVLAMILLPQIARLRQSRADMGNEFAHLASQALQQSNEQFLQLAQTALDQKLITANKDSSFDMERRQKAVEQMVAPIGQSLKDMEVKLETLGKAGAGLEAQLKYFTEDQKHLRDTTNALVNALKNPAARGRWGEMQLERILEQVGLRAGTHFETQKKIENDGQSQKPDFVIHMPNGVHIVIDVKTPMDSYWQYIDAPTEQDGAAHRAQFAQHVRTHVKQLGSKEYFRSFENTPEFVVMFLPSESLYALAIHEDQSLIEDAARANVILASPTTIMGLLRVIHFGWQQQTMALEAKNIAAMATDLYKRLATFGDHFVAMGAALGKSINVYNKAVGSLETSVLPLMRKFRDLDVSNAGKEIPALKQIEETERLVIAPELNHDKDIAGKDKAA